MRSRVEGIRSMAHDDRSERISIVQRLDTLLPAEIAEDVIGGALLVGGVYWFVYLRKRRS
jgi:hypothetical protein